MKYKAVIFDCDGTLLWTLEDLCDAVNYALGKLGYTTRTITEIQGMVGDGIKLLIKRALPIDCKEKINEALSYFKEYYKVHFADKSRPYDGIIEVVKALKNFGVKLAVVSNKNETYLKLLFDKFFSDTIEVVIGESADLAKKPAPDMINKALILLDCKKEEAVYIGDSEVDVQTALNSKLDLIAVSWGFRDKTLLKKCGATTIIDAPEELLTIIGN